MSGLDYLTVLSIVSACIKLGKFYSTEDESDSEAQSDTEVESDVECKPSEEPHDKNHDTSQNLQFQLLVYPEVKELMKRLRGHTANDTRVVSKSSAETIDMGLNILSKKLDKFEDKIIKPYLEDMLGTMDFDVAVEAVTESAIFKSLTTLSELVDELPDFHRNPLPEIQEVLPPGSPTEKLVYAPLPTTTSIRLVRMESRSLSYGTGLRLSFRTVDLSDNPTYSTLSYTWGKPFAIFRSKAERDDPGKDKIQIECGGAVLDVGENLYRFLSQWQRSLTYFDQRRQNEAFGEEEEARAPPAELWIDAICINQEDKAEKAQQVAMMAQIYSTSSMTYIWLGEDDAFSGAAVRMIRSLATAPYKLAEHEALPQDADEICKLLELPPTMSWSWFSVFAFVNRSWFRRSWVVQEAALSPKLQFICGTSVLSWGAMVNACGFMHQTGIAQRVSTYAQMEASAKGRDWLVNEEGTYMETREYDRTESEMNLYMSTEIDQKLIMGTLVLLITQVRHADIALASRDIKEPALLRAGRLEATTPGAPLQAIDTQSVLDLWELSRATRCGNSCDKIFAFTHLAHRACYTSSDTSKARENIRIDYALPVADVFLQGAWYTLLSDSNLRLLSRARSKSLPKEHALPSWVPDWTQETGIQDFEPAALKLGWSASRGKSWVVPEAKLLYQPHLRIQGILVGGMTDLVSGDEFDYAQAMDLAGKLPPEYAHAPGQISPFEVLWRTLVLDSADEVSPAPEELGFDFQCANRNAFIQCVKDTDYGTSGDVDRYYFFLSTFSILPYFEHEEKRFEKSRPEEAREEHTKDFERTMKHFLSSRKLFITDSKHFGLADGHASVHDQVFVVPGAATPLILRHNGTEGQFVFVGEAYVHGIMYGELLERGGGQVEEIVLV